MIDNLIVERDRSAANLPEEEINLTSAPKLRNHPQAHKEPSQKANKNPPEPTQSTMGSVTSESAERTSPAANKTPTKRKQRDSGSGSPLKSQALREARDFGTSCCNEGPPEPEECSLSLGNEVYTVASPPSTQIQGSCSDCTQTSSSCLW